MRVRFDGKRVALVETDQAHKTKLPPVVVLSARRKIRLIRAAKDERDLRGLHSLHFEKLHNEPDGDYSVRVNKQWRIIFLIDDTVEPHEIVITAIKDYH
jgi:proteic killer suppression protein